MIVNIIHYGSMLSYHILLFFCILFFGQTEAVAQDKNVELKNQRSLKLSYFLFSACKYRPIRFTIELYADQSFYSHVYSRRTDVQHEYTTMSDEAVISWISTNYPELTIQMLAGDGHLVIQLIESKLLTLEQYGLNKRVRGLNFSGSVGEIPLYLEKIGLINGVAIVDIPLKRTEFAQLDARTKVTFNADKEKSLRHLIAESFPLKNYSPVLWMAITSPVTNDSGNSTLETRFRFGGPRDWDDPEIKIALSRKLEAIQDSSIDGISNSSIKNSVTGTTTATTNSSSNITNISVLQDKFEKRFVVLVIAFVVVLITIVYRRSRKTSSRLNKSP